MMAPWLTLWKPTITTTPTVILYWLASVSYTHLDVYKRQVVDDAVGLEDVGDGSHSVAILQCERVAGQLTVQLAAGPVSYTHLDVYKRQGRGCDAPASRR